MNQGKRYILYTVIALCGATVLAMAATRVYMATVDDSTPGWLRSVISLGLAVEKNEIPEPTVQTTATTAADLEKLRDFTRIAVNGDLTAEIVSAAEYKVSLTSASSQTWSVATEYQKNGLLALTGGPGTEGAVLRVEAPLLTSIDAQRLRQLTLRGWQAPTLAVRVKNVASAYLEEGAVGHWVLNAETPVVLQLDKATIAFGLDITSSGRISIDGADGRELFNLSGTRSHVTLKSRQ
jgi:hypothetical protein